MALSELEAMEIAKLFAKHFIARPNVMARQSFFGTYAPVQEKFTMPALVNHIMGRDSLGHYMINPDGDEVKLFALDMDLKEAKPKEDLWYLLPGAKHDGVFSEWERGNPRQHWMSREQGPARDFLKFQMRFMANKLARTISALGVKPLVSYSGSKGIHIYGLTGKVPAEMARDGAMVVLQECGWQLSHGRNVFTFKDTGDIKFSDIGYDFSQFDIEVYPKQTTTSDKEKGLGNLMRLPLGVNRKSPKKDASFFLDLREPFVDFKPMNPIEALTTTDIWAYPNE